MSSFSFDIESELNKPELNTAFQATERDLAARYDFKNTPATIEWIYDKSERSGIKITGSNTWQCDQILDIFRKKLAARSQSTKVLDTSLSPVEANMKATWEVPFVSGLRQDVAKKISADIRTSLPKLKPTIQGESIRVTGSSKDDLQAAMQLVKDNDYDAPINFTNYR